MDKISNEEFFKKYAAPGLVGLVGGSALIDKTIRKAQNPIVKDKKNSLWSHAFIFSEKRADGYQWVIESDLDFRHKQTRLGVQENRISKYFDSFLYPNVAVLDFNLTKKQTELILVEALGLLSSLTKYSIRELAGTLMAMYNPSLRSKKNLLALNNTYYCSALVQQCYSKAEILFKEGISLKNITPEDIAGTNVVHKKNILARS
jgi:hypothetical protein